MTSVAATTNHSYEGMIRLDTEVNGSPVSGWYRPEFSGVKDAFLALYEPDQPEPEIGSTVSAYTGDQLEFELVGGWADEARTKPWRPDTIVTVMSVTKGLAAICIHMLADRGKLDIEAPVATYWPEF